MPILVPAGEAGPSPWRLFAIGIVVGAILMHILRPTEVRVVRFRVLDGGGEARADAGR